MPRNFKEMLKNAIFKHDSRDASTTIDVGIFNNLPAEIILHLFTFLNCKDQIKMSLINSYFIAFADEQLKKNKHFETMKFFKEKKYIFENGIMKRNPNFKTLPEFQTCGCQRK